MILLASALVIASTATAAPVQHATAAFQVEGTVLVDGMTGLAGGLRRDVVGLFLARGTLTLDGSQVLGVPGLTLSAAALATGGGGPSDLVGDLQGISNIEAPGNLRPFEIWLQQNGLDGRLSVLAGLYDVNSEFDVLDAAGEFINSSFGIGADFGLSGPNGPSIFPTTGLAVRVAGAPAQDIRLRFLVADGTPGDPADPEAFDPAWRAGDGTLLVGEAVRYFGAEQRKDGQLGVREGPRHAVGRTAERGAPGKLGVGLWSYQGFDHQEPGWGAYVLAEGRVAGDGAVSTLGLFARMGYASMNASPVRIYLGTGLSVHGVSPQRPHDIIGLGAALAWVHEDPLSAEGHRLDRGTPESVLELTYQARISEYLYVQPSVQWVGQPVDPDAASSAWVGTLRLGLAP